MTTIADQILALKPGDRVRVTIEDEVLYSINKPGERLEMNDWSFFADDQGITSIEVIKRALAVGDRVIEDESIGEIRAIADERAMIQWDEGFYGLAQLSDLRRVTP
jgi:hypothetical protein